MWSNGRVAAIDPELAAALAGARAGSPASFERIYEELAGPVASYLRWNGASDPEGLTNEVMGNVYRGLDRFTGEWPAFRSWVFTIAHHRMVDDRRKARRRPPVIDDASTEHVEVQDGEADAMRALGDERVLALLASLSVDQREVLLLRIVADLPLEEVAVSLNKSVGAVKSLQHRALATLRRHLEPEDVEQ